jgi:hypothetical protein
MPDGLVWWVAGSGTDRTGGGRTLTLGGNAGWDANGLTMDGSGDYATLADANEIEPATITACCWLKRAATGTRHSVLAKRRGTEGATPCYLGFDVRADNKIESYAYSGSWRSTLSSGTVGTSWTHLAVVAQSNALRTYINGVADGSTTGTFNLVANAQPFYWGYDPYEPAHYSLNGSMDGMMIFNADVSAKLNDIMRYSSGRRA